MRWLWSQRLWPWALYTPWGLHKGRGYARKGNQGHRKRREKKHRDMYHRVQTPPPFPPLPPNTRCVLGWWLSRQTVFLSCQLTSHGFHTHIHIRIFLRQQSSIIWGGGKTALKQYLQDGGFAPHAPHAQCMCSACIAPPAPPSATINPYEAQTPLTLNSPCRTPNKAPCHMIQLAM